MLFFSDFEQQDRTDLEYGGQLAACRDLASEDTAFVDHSITEEWTPDED